MSANSLNNRRRNPTRRTEQSSSSTSQNGTTSGQQNGRSLRAAANNKKTYFVDSDSSDSDEAAKNLDVKAVSSPTKSRRGAKTTNGTASKSNDENINKLESITGLSRVEAVELLEACGNDIEKAIDVHFGGGGVSEVASKSAASGSNGTSAKKAVNTKPKSAMKRHHEEIVEESEAISVEDEDESYKTNSNSNSNFGDDNVRAPIPPKMEKLLDYDPYDSLVGETGKKKSFSTLFRPPVDLLFDGSFEAAKGRASKLNKWVMLNVQRQDDFTSKCLNRDVWSDETVKEIVKANFVFTQIYFDSVEGKKLENMYSIHTYPFIAIIDPQTGEKLTQFPTKIDPCTFCEKVTSFLCDHEAPYREDEQANGDEADIVEVDKTDEIKNIKETTTTTKPIEKPKKATDLIESSKEIFTKDDIFDNEEDEDDDEKKEEVERKIAMKKTYEDDTVVSKDKYKKIEPEKCKETSEQKFSSVSKPSSQPTMKRFETKDSQKKDCVLRILYPNGDRLDFCTNGNSKLTILVDYLISEGIQIKDYELIERLMPTSSLKPTTTTNNHAETSSSNQSRNLFNSDTSLSFKELNLFPRVFLLLQES